jgi:hypothetical protein
MHNIRAQVKIEQARRRRCTSRTWALDARKVKVEAERTPGSVAEGARVPGWGPDTSEGSRVPGSAIGQRSLAQVPGAFGPRLPFAQPGATRSLSMPHVESRRDYGKTLWRRSLPLIARLLRSLRLCLPSLLCPSPTISSARAIAIRRGPDSDFRAHFHRSFHLLSAEPSAKSPSSLSLFSPLFPLPLPILDRGIHATFHSKVCARFLVYELETSISNRSTLSVPDLPNSTYSLLFISLSCADWLVNKPIFFNDSMVNSLFVIYNI